MNILITGGAGFVCSHLADKLYEKKTDRKNISYNFSEINI